MKRIVIYIAALALLTLAPVQEAELGKMRPVEVVLVYLQNDILALSTDTGDTGQGPDVRTALENLKATTPGIIYLDTAEYLLVAQDAETAAEQLKSHLKKSVKVCAADPQIDLKAAAEFLPVHGDLPKLKDWKTGDKLPRLTAVGERFLLMENS